MAEPDEQKKQLLIRVFTEFRRTVPSLRIGDLLDALRLVEGGWDYDALSDGEGKRSLQSGIRLLWCRRSQKEHLTFNQLWAKHSAPVEPAKKSSMPSAESSRSDAVREPERAPEQRPPIAPAPGEWPRPRPAVASALPVKSPTALSPHAGPTEIGSIWPLTRRTMAYGWQYLRRPRNDGPETVFDLDATIKRLAREGDLIEAAYARASRNHAHLVLLIDRQGSMAPFHPFTRMLVESALDAERDQVLRRVDIFYFHDFTASRLYSDPRLSNFVMARDNPPRLATLDEALALSGRDTRLMIVSDAGALRGKIEGQRDRISSTLEMIVALSRITPSLVWLNPMPKRRWKNTAAETIRSIVDMFDISKEEFHNAIRALRG